MDGPQNRSAMPSSNVTQQLEVNKTELRAGSRVEFCKGTQGNHIAYTPGTVADFRDLASIRKDDILLQNSLK